MAPRDRALIRLPEFPVRIPLAVRSPERPASRVARSIPRADRGPGAGSEPGNQRVVAAAGNELPCDPTIRIMQFEHEPGVVIDAAAEAVANAFVPIDAALATTRASAFEPIEGRVRAKSRLLTGFAQRRRRIVGRPAPQKLFDQDRFRGQRGGGSEFGLFDETIGDFGDASSADRADPGDRQQVGDEVMRSLGIGVGKAASTPWYSPRLPRREGEAGEISANIALRLKSLKAAVSMLERGRALRPARKTARRRRRNIRVAEP